MCLIFKKLFLVGVICISLLTNISKASEVENIDSIIWETEDYPPYNYQNEKGDIAGVSTDAVVRLLNKAGSKKTVKDIELLPWARAYKELQLNKNYALFSTGRTAEREELFKWVGPLANSRIVVFAKKSSNIKLVVLDDIKKYQLGAVTNDIGQQLVNQVFANPKMELTSTLEQGVAKLEAGNIDLLAGDETVMKYLIQQSKLDANNFESIYVLREVKYWIALNKETSDALVQSMQSALDQK